MATDISNNSTTINVNSTDPALKIVQSGTGTPFKIQDNSDVRKNVYVRANADARSSLQATSVFAQVVESQAEMNNIVNGNRVASPDAILARWKTFDHSGNQDVTTTTNDRPFTQAGRIVSIVTAGFMRSVRAGSVITVNFENNAACGLLQNVTGTYTVLENTNLGVAGGNLVISVTQNQNILAGGGAECTVIFHESDCWGVNPDPNRQDELTCLENTNVFVGFVTDVGYENYVLDVVVRSTDGDDDMLGLVLAFNVDSDGNESTLQACRHLDGGVGGGVEGSSIRYNNGLVGAETLASVVEINEPTGWSAANSGSRIRIIRQGDQFTVDTTHVRNNGVDYFAGRTWAQIINDAERQANFNLNLNNNANTLRFRGPQPVGVTTISQANSFFRIINFTNTDSIYDISRNVMRTYNVAAGNWNAEVAFNPSTVFGVETYIHDPFTKKTYFINRTTNTMTKFGGDIPFLDESSRINKQAEILNRFGFVFEDAGGTSSRIRVQNDGTFAFTAV